MRGAQKCPLRERERVPGGEGGTEMPPPQCCIKHSHRAVLELSGFEEQYTDSKEMRQHPAHSIHMYINTLNSPQNAVVHDGPGSGIRLIPPVG